MTGNHAKPEDETPDVAAAATEPDTETAEAETPQQAEPEPEPEPQEKPLSPELAATLAALAAEVAAAVEAVEAEITADLNAHAEAEAAFLLQIDAHIAAERQIAATNPTTDTQMRNVFLKSASDTIAHLVAEDIRARAEQRLAEAAFAEAARRETVAFTWPAEVLS
jgi:hypothetical protein